MQTRIGEFAGAALVLVFAAACSDGGATVSRNFTAKV